jgi:hypothetical protein
LPRQIDLIIQQSRLKDGSRKVTAITEVAGMEGDTVVLTDIFKFEQTGISQDGKVIGELKPTGIRPLFTPRLEAAGFKLGPRSIWRQPLRNVGTPAPSLPQIELLAFSSIYPAGAFLGKARAFATGTLESLQEKDRMMLLRNRVIGTNMRLATKQRQPFHRADE